MLASDSGNTKADPPLTVARSFIGSDIAHALLQLVQLLLQLSVLLGHLLVLRLPLIS